MIKSKWKNIEIILFCALAFGNTAYALEEFFWSDVEYVPSCVSTTRDGASGKIGLTTADGKITETTVTCEEAMKKRVLVRVNGKYLHIRAGTEAEPFIENGRTMIPLRVMADAFGFEVDWEQNEQKITLKKDGKSIVMHIGKQEMLVDGEQGNFEGAVPMIKSNLTYLPVRQLAEILGIQIEWDEDTRTATFTSN